MSSNFFYKKLRITEKQSYIGQQSKSPKIHRLEGHGHTKTLVLLQIYFYSLKIISKFKYYFDLCTICFGAYIFLKCLFFVIVF